jgi:hypothetical protein
MGISINQSYDDIKKRILESDPTYRVWEFGKPANFGPDFQSGNFIVSIIDQFGGMVPRLTSYETLMGYNLPLVRTTILDSNVMSLLNDFVVRPEKLSVDKRQVAIDLLDYFILTGTDYNPTFYSFEAFWKNRGSDISERYIEFTKSLLSLHMMDERHFLQKREIRPDKRQLRNYSEKFGTSNLEEMARRDFAYTSKVTSSQDDLNAFYVLLLKMALIHKTSSKNIVAKMKALYEFTLTNFGVLFGEEMGIAAHYFAGKLDKLIPLQKGAGYENSISKLRSTTWDIYLLRFPPMLLSQHEPPLPFSKICTGERQLAYIGRKFFIVKLFSNKNNFLPALQIDYSDLYTLYSEEVMKKLFQLHEKFESERTGREIDNSTLPDDQKINGLKDRLEDELKSFVTK